MLPQPAADLNRTYKHPAPADAPVGASARITHRLSMVSLELWSVRPWMNYGDDLLREVHRPGTLRALRG